MSIFNFHGTDFEEYAPENSVLKNPPIKWNPEDKFKTDELFTYMNATSWDDYNPNTSKFIGDEIKELAELAGIDVNYLRVETNGPKVHIEVEAERNGLFARFKFYMGEQNWFSYDNTYKTVIRFKTSKVKELLSRINDELNKVEANRKFPFLKPGDDDVLNKVLNDRFEGDRLYKMQISDCILEKLDTKALAVLLTEYTVNTTEEMVKFAKIAMQIEEHARWEMNLRYDDDARIAFAKYAIKNQHLTLQEGGKRFLRTLRKR